MSMYGCHNKPRPIANAPLIVQDGYHPGPPDTRIALMVEAPFRMNTDCQYTKTHASDPQCSGCVHRHKELS
jgi:hypothetical protein